MVSAYKLNRLAQKYNKEYAVVEPRRSEAYCSGKFQSHLKMVEREVKEEAEKHRQKRKAIREKQKESGEVSKE